MRAWLPALIFVLGEAQAIAAPYTVLGAGTMSCAKWLDNDIFRKVGEHWAKGFWSGLSALNQANHERADKLDAYAVLGEIKRECVNHPSEDLNDAVVTVYLKVTSGLI